MDRSLVRLIALAHVAAAAFLIDERMRPQVDWLEPFWTVALLLAFPLGAAVAIDGRRTAFRVIGGVFGLGALVMPVGRWVTSQPRELFLHQPELLIVPTFVCLGIIAIVAVLDLDLDRYGLGRGDLAWWGPRTVALLAACVPFILVAAWLFPALLEYYPSKIARGGARPFVEAMLGRGVYFAAWEWFFRGYLLFGLAPAIGARGAILTQSYPFLLVHRTKPVAEMGASFTGSLGLAAFCWRGGSMWPAFLLHWFMNVLMEVIGLLWHVGP